MAHVRKWKGTALARNEVRPLIKMRSTAGTGYTYVTRKNRRNTPDRLTLRKYDPTIRRHVLFREER
ncbi:large subunit ribosomal protein L33 [Nonomuraea jiangxiensis]|uniref:Large ribosomal subunit protein bL33 n=1 Tax=Nonomuraea jiangxiensis TaxID=633440 RepID=A0A1G9A0M8_9ACTN|nr:large subunit ribosomal protein L33 [Nonomuraea jiangxiensis]